MIFLLFSLIDVQALFPFAEVRRPVEEILFIYQHHNASVSRGRLVWPETFVSHHATDRPRLNQNLFIVMFIYVFDYDR